LCLAVSCGRLGLPHGHAGRQEFTLCPRLSALRACCLPFGCSHRGCGLIMCGDCTPAPKLLLPVQWGAKSKAPQRVCGSCALSLATIQSQLIQNAAPGTKTVAKPAFSPTKWALGIK
jgi:hypothetical protein